MAADLGRELLILGMLRRSAMSAYTLNRAVREHVPLYRPFKGGNVYHAVVQLASKGFLLEKRAASRRGPRGEKIIFRLSALGERRFQSLLSDVLSDVQAADPTVEIAYVLLGQLSREDARALLAMRSDRVAEQERRLSRIAGEIGSRSGAGYLALAHTISRLRGERRYLRDAIALLDNPKWNPDWVLNDGPIVDRSRRL